MAPSPAIREDVARKPSLQDASVTANRFHLILWNDDVSPVSLVIHMLMRVLRYTRPDAVIKTMAVGRNGRGIIFTGSQEVCELHKEQLGEAKLTTTIEAA